MNAARASGGPPDLTRLEGLDDGRIAPPPWRMLSLPGGLRFPDQATEARRLLPLLAARVVTRDALGCGVASLLGVTLDLPTIGVAKSLLVGKVAALGAEVGATAPMLCQGRAIGVALRSRLGANPIYVSIGHRVSLETALGWVRATLRGRRLPEPTRRAHDGATRVRLAALAGAA